MKSITGIMYQGLAMVVVMVWGFKIIKRGYLLYGPPGTGKSTMIAAMANFLNYDVYDLELAAVKDNSELRRLLIETSNKSIIVIEDIDCSLDLTSQRSKKGDESDEEDEEGADPGKTLKEKAKKEKEEKDGKVTLSSLLNLIDALVAAKEKARLNAEEEALKAGFDEAEEDNVWVMFGFDPKCWNL